MAKQHHVTRAEKAIIKAAGMKAGRCNKVRLDVQLRASSTDQEDYNILRLADNMDQADIHSWGHFNKIGFQFADGKAKLDIGVYAMTNDDYHGELLINIQPVWENGVLVSVYSDEGRKAIWSIDA